MELHDTTNQTTAKFGRWSGTVHWHPELATEFRKDEDRQAIIALFDEAMCTFNTVTLYLNHTTYNDKEIAWSSTVDAGTHEIRVEASLSKRPELFDGKDQEWVAALIEEIEWYDETFNKTGRPFPDTLEEYREEFYQWKANKEAGR
jgi:hypothetical protein